MAATHDIIGLRPGGGYVPLEGRLAPERAAELAEEFAALLEGYREIVVMHGPRLVARFRCDAQETPPVAPLPAPTLLGESMSRLLVRVAATLPQPFTLADLTVAAWRDDRARLSLPGHPEHADSAKVAPYLMGEKGLVRAGFFKQEGPKRYSVTPAGRKAVEETQDE